MLLDRLSVSRIFRYGYVLALFAPLCATALNAWLFGSHVPYITHYPAVMLVATAAGLRPGVLATLFSALCVYLRFGFHSTSLALMGGLPGLFLFVSIGIAISFLSAALHARDQQLNAFFDSSPIGMAVLASNLRPKRVNAALASLAHSSPAEFLSLTIRETFPNWAELFESHVQRVLQTGQPQQAVNFTAGTAANLHHYEFSYFPIARKGRRPTDVGVLCVDFTKTKNLKDALRRNESRLKQAQKLAGLGTWQWDSARDIVFWSEEIYEIFGLDPSEPPPPFSRHPELYTPESFSLLQSHVALCLETGQPYELELQAVRPDGTTRWGIARGALEQNDSGLTTGLQGTFQDIHDRKIAGQKIQASLAEKEVLLKEIHHRVKNNLQIVSSLLRMQSRRLYDPQIKELFRESENRILALASIHESLYQASDFNHIDLTQYLRGVMQSVAASYNKPAVVCALAENPPVNVEMHWAVPCGLIVNELVSNSLKHAFPENKGILTLSVHRRSQAVLFSIEDNGVGLPLAFEDDHRKSMGFQLVKSLVTRQLHGTVLVTSTSGTRFDIEFQDLTSA